METRDIRNQRLGALFLLGSLFFNYPLISLFNVDGVILGIPVLYAYLFATWAVLIGLIALYALIAYALSCALSHVHRTRPKTAWAIAIHEAQRMAMQADPSFYEDKDTGGAAGMRAAAKELPVKPGMVNGSTKYSVLLSDPFRSFMEYTGGIVQNISVTWDKGEDPTVKLNLLLY